MQLKTLAVALPNSANIGWGLAGRRITEELKKISLCYDLNGTGIMESDRPVTIDGNVLQAIQGVNCLPTHPHIRSQYGHQVGLCFIENNLRMREYAENIARYFGGGVICGSTWAKDQMDIALAGGSAECHGGAQLAIQGVDSDIFCPAAEPKTDPAWFTVFSGGKWEFRKGQDVVVAAMKVMMDRHDDVRLLANWWNPWPQTAESMESSKLIQYTSDSRGYAGCPFDLELVCSNHGLPMGCVELLGQVNHADLVNVYRRADVALFPNRCEAGTNLPLMEAAACGVPIIATVQHGHADMAGAMAWHLKESEKFIVADAQGPFGEWYEPNLEETIAALEAAYLNWHGLSLPGLGRSARNAVLPFTWAACAKSILGVF